MYTGEFLSNLLY